MKETNLQIKTEKSEVSLRDSLRPEASTSLDCTVTNDRVITFTKTKVIKSAHVLEIYEYGSYLRLGADTSKFPKSKKVVKESERNDEYRDRTAIRARNNVRRLALANFSKDSIFATFTFVENWTDMPSAVHEFGKFVKRLRRIYGEFIYLTVPEFQKRGAIHFHTLIDLPFIPQRELEEIWGHGIIFVKDIKEVDNVGAYISKYMIKDVKDERLKGCKCYFTSRGLIRPQVIYGKEAEDLIKSLRLNEKIPHYQSGYDTQRNGRTNYREFNLQRNDNYYPKLS